VPDAELGVEGGLSPEGGFALPHRALEVFGVQTVLPGLQGSLDLQAGRSVQFEHPVVPDHGSRLEVPVPDGHAGGVRGEPQTLIALHQGFLSHLALGDVLDDAHHGHGLIVSIPVDLPLPVDPPALAVGGAEDGVVQVEGFMPLDDPGEVGRHPVPEVRGHDLQPSL